MNQDEKDIQSLYMQLIRAWNGRNADQMAALFENTGEMVGFDGSSIAGKQDIYAHLDEIFQNYSTAPFTSIIKHIRFPKEDIAFLRAVVGMVPDGDSNINPALNAIQTLAAIRRQGNWEITLFQNTPAAFHGRPEIVAQMTAELETQQQQK